MITCSTCSSVTVPGAPDRGSSTNPCSRRCTNRDRHLPTVRRDTPSLSATAALLAPSAHAEIRDRNANCYELVRRLVHRSSVSRSSPVSTSSAFGRPRPAYIVAGTPNRVWKVPVRHDHYLITNLRRSTQSGWRVAQRPAQAWSSAEARVRSCGASPQPGSVSRAHTSRLALHPLAGVWAPQASSLDRPLR